MSALSALYSGVVTHSRTRPRRHALRYRIFQILFDIDELDELDRRLKLFSRNRFNLIGFYDRDHGPKDGGGAPGRLRAWIEGALAGAGIPGGGRIQVMCMPRILGYVFNPISVWLCHGPDGALNAVLYEVNNTFGQRHSYLFDLSGQTEGAGDGAVLQHACDKAFYVSPFMDLDMRYAFALQAPGERFALTIHGSDAEGLLISAGFSAGRAPLTDANLWRACLAAPLLTLKVVAGIHWEALKLFLKGVRLTRRPKAPAEAVTVG